MAISYSNPTVWSARVLQYLDKTFVYKAALTNNDYEGVAKYNGTVKAFYVTDISVTDYTGGWTAADWAELTDAEKTFAVDQAKKALFKIPDVTQNGSILRLIDQGSQRLAQAVGDVVDQFIASKHSQVAAGNAYGDSTTPIVVGLGAGEVKPTLALELLHEKLVDARAPMTNPRVVVPTWFGTMLKTELGARHDSLGATVTVNGIIVPRPGLIARNVGSFDQIYQSPNVPHTTGTKYKVLAGDPMITFANAIEKMKEVDIQDDFATGMKALYVYGAKLLRGEYMALGTWNRGTN